MTAYTVFALREEDLSKRHTMHVEADSPEDAEKKARLTAPFNLVVSAVVKGRIEALDHTTPDVTPINGKGYETTVAQLTVGYRKIRIPFECPNCKADLHQYESVRQWDYWDYYWEGRIPRGVYKGDNGIAVNHEKGARTGSGFETTIVAIMLACSACHHELWNGHREG